MIRFRVRLGEPIDFRRSLDRFGRFGDDLIDRWDGVCLTSTVPDDQGGVSFRCTARAGSVRDLQVTVAFESGRTPVARAVKRLFLNASATDLARLVDIDPVIGRLNETLPGVRPVLEPDLFTALIRGISAQQVNLRWAATTRSRLARAFGVRHEIDGCEVYSLNPAILAKAVPSDIRALQFTMRKAESIIAVARECANSGLTTESIRNLPDEEVMARLTKIKGIGPWSADWVLCRTLGRPRVVAGDLGVRKVVGRAYCGGALPPEDEVRKITAHWGESTTIAQALILHGYT